MIRQSMPSGFDPRVERFGDKIMRYSIFSERDRAQNRCPLLLTENKTGRGAIRGRFLERALSKRLSPLDQSQVLLMSTSLVSGRKKKPTTAVMAAKTIGYQRPA